MGGVPAEQGVALYAYSALLQFLGAPAWLIERVTHATLLAGGAIGAALVTRELIPRHRIAHVVAGVWWIASPVTAASLLPSSNYLYAAVSPWLALAVLRGSTSSSRWRWAAALALAIGVAGLTNPPALILASLPLIPLTIYLIATNQSSPRATATFALRAGLLAALVLAFEAYRLKLTSVAYGRRLAISAPADVVSQSSSWTESLRGLGRWDSYPSLRGNPLKPSLTGLVHNPAVIIASFVAVAIAIGVVALSRRRVAVLLGCTLLLSATVMVGAFPFSDPSPYGRALRWAYDAIPLTFVFRNGFKASSGLLLAMCVLLAIAATALSSWWRQDKRRRALPTAAAALGASLVLLATASPLWTGAVYEDQKPINGIPSYWMEATAWLDAQGGSSRVLILPGNIETYRWGSTTNGDLFSTFLHRPYVRPSPVSQLARDADNLITAVNTALSLGRYEQGSVGPIAQRMGVGYVLLRNDALRNASGNAARPALFDALRTDPALVLDATFGRVGENVVATDDRSPSADRERELPPVEIYRVRGNNEPVRAVSRPSLLVSGDGAAWPALARDHSLDQLGPIRYTGRMTAAQLDDDLRAGASLAITDSNRRRPPSPRGSYSIPELTMSATQAGNATDLFSVPGSQSVVTYPDAVDILNLAPPSESSEPSEGAEHGPAAAFDGDPATTFVSGRFSPLRRNDGLRVQLEKPVPLSEMSIDATASAGRRVTKAEIAFPDGASVPIDLSSGRATVTFPTHVTDTFDVRVTELSAQPTAGDADLAAWSINEITIPGLDLTAELQMPDDVMRIADTDQPLRELLAAAPVSYHFHRLQDARPDEEASLRRRFRVLATRTFNGSGTVQLRSSATSAERDAVSGGANAPRSSGLPTTCHVDLATVDGAPLGLELTGTVDQLLGGQPIAAKLCAPVGLSVGWHTLTSSSNLVLSDLTLATSASSASAAPIDERPLTARWASETDARVEMSGGTRLILGQAAFAGWEATANGRALDAPIELDTQLGWEIPDAGATTVRARFTPQRTSDLMILISGAGLLACIALVILDPRAAATRRKPTRGRHFAPARAPRWFLTVVTCAFGVLIAGLTGFALAAGGLIVLRKRYVSRPALAALCIACVVAAAFLYLPPVGPALGIVRPGWALDRLRAHEIARAAVVVLAVLLATGQDRVRDGSGERGVENYEEVR